MVEWFFVLHLAHLTCCKKQHYDSSWEKNLLLSSRPDNAYHLRDQAQLANDIGKVQAIGHSQGEMQGGVCAFIAEVDIFDVGFCFGDRSSHFCQHAALIGNHQLEADIEGAADILIPHHIQPLFT